MGRPSRFLDRNSRLFFEMGEAFGQVRSLLDLRECVETHLVPSCQADHVALCMALPERPTEYEWKTRTLDGLLRDYSEWAHEDFVRGAVMRRPNRALSDTHMLRGGKVEDTETWRRSRAHGMKLRHVMSAAIVPGQGGGHGGVTFYSERQKPFSAEQQQVFEWFLPGLQRAFLLLSRPCEGALLREDWSARLTLREREVANLLLSRGGLNQQLAEELGISEDTVKAHLKRIFKETGSENRTDFMARGRR